MTFPQLPTDNFYKFVSFVGFIICLLSLSVFYFEHRLVVDSIYLEGEQKKLQFDIDKNTIDIERVTKMLKQKSDPQSINELQEKTEVKNRENRFSNIDNTTRQNLIVHYQEKAKVLKRLSYFGLFLGALLASVGLFFWYFKSQKFQDLKLYKSLKSEN